MKKRLLLTGFPLFLCFLLNSALAQELPGIRDSLYSEVLGEKRYIQVVFPQNYKKDTKEKYDVLYLLDGEWLTKEITDIGQFVEKQGFMPPTLVVGIINVNRNRDFVPIPVDGFPATGGADKFLAFIKTELIPYVNATYRSTGVNTLYGHSFGGVFSLYTFLKEPGLFYSYLAAEPAYSTVSHFLNPLAQKALGSFSYQDKSFYISGREEGDYKSWGIATIDSIFSAQAPDDLHWKCVTYPHETHGSINFKTAYDGLKFTYGGYNVADIHFHPMNGTMLKDKPIHIWTDTDPSYVRYTTDGSEPIRSSSPLGREIILKSPAELKTKVFGTRATKEIKRNGLFKEGKVLAAYSKPKNIKEGGFNYAYYEGSWKGLPEFNRLKPQKKGYTDKEFDSEKITRKKDFAFLIEGYIQIQKEGYHMFGMSTANGSKLYIGDQLLIHYDEQGAKHDFHTYILPLERGFYPIRVEYLQKEEEGKLLLLYRSADKNSFSPIPFEFQYSRK